MKPAVIQWRTRQRFLLPTTPKRDRRWRQYCLADTMPARWLVSELNAFAAVGNPAFMPHTMEYRVKP